MSTRMPSAIRPLFYGSILALAPIMAQATTIEDAFIEPYYVNYDPAKLPNGPSTAPGRHTPINSYTASYQATYAQEIEPGTNAISRFWQNPRHSYVEPYYVNYRY